MARKAHLQRLRSELGRGISRAWEELTEGWRELLTRSNGALTHFIHPAGRRSSADAAPGLPRWSLLAADAWETAHAVIVRLELPGVKQEDVQVSIHRGILRIRGEKRAVEISSARTYHLMERAFGRFERKIALPHDIDPNKTELSYQEGVLTVIVPKTKPSPPTRPSVS